MFRVEIAKAWHRPRTWVFAAGLSALAVLPVILLRGLNASGQGALFFSEVRHSGLFAALAAVALIQPFFLPLGTSLLSGESIAGEASNGTLRYLLVRPVTRSRMVLEKFAAVIAQVGLAVLLVIVVGIVAGAIGFGLGPMPTLSGATLGVGSGLVRILAAGAYVLLGVTGLAAVGVLISTLTDAGLGAAAATLSLAIASQIMDNLSSLRAIHAFLPTHGWLAYADLFRSPVEWSEMERGALVYVAYVLVFLTAALFTFGRRDVHS
jgi:ABC-2 type transport system permease protein